MSAERILRWLGVGTTAGETQLDEMRARLVEWTKIELGHLESRISLLETGSGESPTETSTTPICESTEAGSAPDRTASDQSTRCEQVDDGWL